MKPKLAQVPVTVTKQGRMSVASCDDHGTSAMGFNVEDALRALKYRIHLKTGLRPEFQVTVR